jgi:hypothetical protein
LTLAPDASVFSSVQEGAMEKAQADLVTLKKQGEELQKQCSDLASTLKSINETLRSLNSWVPHVDATLQGLQKTIDDVGQRVTQLEVNQIEAEQQMPVTTPDPAAPGTSSAALKVLIPNRPVSRREFPHTPIHFDIGDRSGTYEPSEYNAGRGGHQRSRPPKTEFPRFDGENPKWWKKVSEKYFALYAVDHDTWASFASMHFVGNAALWLQSYEAEHDVDGWEELCVAVHTKFGKNKHQ